MKPNEYKDIPYDLIRELIDTYERKEKYFEGSTMYEQYEEKILKLKGAFEKVVFAIPNNKSENYKAFESIFKEA